MTSQISQISLMDSVFEKPYVQKYNQTGPLRKKTGYGLKIFKFPSTISNESTYKT